jgi:hypothetical protein
MPEMPVAGRQHAKFAAGGEAPRRPAGAALDLLIPPACCRPPSSAPIWSSEGLRATAPSWRHPAHRLSLRGRFARRSQS